MAVPGPATHCLQTAWFVHGHRCLGNLHTANLPRVCCFLMLFGAVLEGHGPASSFPAALLCSQALEGGGSGWSALGNGLEGQPAAVSLRDGGTRVLSDHSAKQSTREPITSKYCWGS